VRVGGLDLERQEPPLEKLSSTLGEMATILKKGVERCLIEWEHINNGLMSGRKLKGGNIALIQCYASTNESSGETMTSTVNY
jgi:hypothetical protein